MLLADHPERHHMQAGFPIVRGEQRLLLRWEIQALQNLEMEVDRVRDAELSGA